MSKPKCKLCGVQHWSYEPHVLPERVTKVEPPVTKVSPSVTKLGRPRQHETNAQRQAAYRQRQANLP